jgi:sec-independent protein translocase protein TatB
MGPRDKPEDDSSNVSKFEAEGLMFDLGWSKVLILAVVAIVVVGPKELPALLRTLGQFISQLRRHAAEFRAQFDEAMKSTELDQIKKDVEAIKTDAEASFRGIERSIEQDVSEAKTSVDQAFETLDAKPANGHAAPDTPVIGEAVAEAGVPLSPPGMGMGIDTGAEAGELLPARQPEPIPLKTGA